MASALLHGGKVRPSPGAGLQAKKRVKQRKRPEAAAAAAIDPGVARRGDALVRSAGNATSHPTLVIGMLLAEASASFFLVYIQTAALATASEAHSPALAALASAAAWFAAAYAFSSVSDAYLDPALAFVGYLARERRHRDPFTLVYHAVCALAHLLGAFLAGALLVVYRTGSGGGGGAGADSTVAATAATGFLSLQAARELLSYAVPGAFVAATVVLSSRSKRLARKKHAASFAGAAASAAASVAVVAAGAPIERATTNPAVLVGAAIAFGRTSLVDLAVAVAGISLGTVAGAYLCELIVSLQRREGSAAAAVPPSPSHDTR